MLLIIMMFWWLSRKAAAPEARTRARAARALGQLQSPKATTLLRNLLEDEDPFVRRAAADGLRKRDWNPKPEERARLFVELEQFEEAVKEGAVAVPFLVDQLRDTTRRESASCAIFLVGAPATKSLGKALTDPNEDVRREVALILANLREDPAAFDLLLQSLGDHDDQVREIAYRTLVPSGPSPNTDARVLNRLVEILRSDQPPRLRVRAARALEVIGNKTGLKALEAVYKENWETYQKGSICKRLISTMARREGLRISKNEDYSFIHFESWEKEFLQELDSSVGPLSSQHVQGALDEARHIALMKNTNLHLQPHEQRPQFTYIVISDADIAARDSHQYRLGEGSAIEILFDRPLASIRSARGEAAELDGIIHCTCGTSSPFKTGYQWDGGRPVACRACHKQTHIQTASHDRARLVGDNALLLCAITNDRRPVRISIEKIAGGLSVTSVSRDRARPLGGQPFVFGVRTR